METQRALELLRADLSLHQAAREVATGALTATNAAVLSRRLNAISELWKTIMKLNASTPGWLTLLDLLGYRADWAGSQLNSAIRAFKLEDLHRIAELNEPVWRCRPFLGERLFSLFYAYQALHGSAQSITYFRYKETGDLPQWWKDNHSVALLRSVFSPGELEQLNSLDTGQYQWTREKLEAKILEEIQKVISGKAVATEGLEQARQVLAAARQLEGAETAQIEKHE